MSVILQFLYHIKAGTTWNLSDQKVETLGPKGGTCSVVFSVTSDESARLLFFVIWEVELAGSDTNDVWRSRQVALNLSYHFGSGAFQTFQTVFQIFQIFQTGMVSFCFFAVVVVVRGQNLTLYGL